MATIKGFDTSQDALKKKIEESICNTHYTAAEVDQKLDRQLRMMRAHKWKSASKRKR